LLEYEKSCAYAQLFFLYCGQQQGVSMSEIDDMLCDEGEGYTRCVICGEHITTDDGADEDTTICLECYEADDYEEDEEFSL
jgi:hypothetical protein